MKSEGANPYNGGMKTTAKLTLALLLLIVLTVFLSYAWLTGYYGVDVPFEDFMPAPLADLFYWLNGLDKANACQEDMACWDCRTMGNGICGTPSQ